MNQQPHLRRLTRSDLPFADSLRALAGWNQTLADWERFLTAEPAGCFLAERNGVPAGTATTTVYGPDLAWIGMVLVHPEHRRRGVGRALLRQCIEHLHGQHVRCLKLDATPAGQQVYEAMGFQAEWTLTRWQREGTPLQHNASDPRIRRLHPSDLNLIEPLDAAAFGLSRGWLLRLLTAQCHAAVVLEPQPGTIDGYGLLRTGSRALYLGPVVAVSTGVALRVVDALLEHAGSQPIYWDIPDPISAAIVHARHHGFTTQRTLTRMFLGQNQAPGDPQRQFALSGPETG